MRVILFASVLAVAESATELTADTWDALIDAHTGEPYVWGVKFHSKMCGSCKELIPAWEALQSSQSGLHWGEVNIDRKENIPLASKFGVLDEGIPNIKLFTAGGEAVPLLTGDMIGEAALTGDSATDAQILSDAVEHTLTDTRLTAAKRDESGNYRFEL